MRTKSTIGIVGKEEPPESGNVRPSARREECERAWKEIDFILNGHELRGDPSVIPIHDFRSPSQPTRGALVAQRRRSGSLHAGVLCHNGRAAGEDAYRDPAWAAAKQGSGRGIPVGPS